MAGLAFIGVAHIHTRGFMSRVSEHPDVSVVSMFDDDAHYTEKALEWAPDAVVAASVEEALAVPGVDAIVVCTQTLKHQAVIAQVVATGKPIFIEKPIGFAVEDALAIADLVAESGNVFQTGYFMRGIGELRRVKELVDAGAFGQITRVRASNCHRGALGGWFDGDMRWMADPKQSGVGGFGDLGTHMLDILIWMFGDAERVTGRIGLGTARYEGCDETGEAILVFKNGVVATLAAGWDDITDPQTFMVSGTELHASVVYGKLKLTKLDGPYEGELEDACTSAPAGFDAFLTVCTGGTADLVGVREAAYRNVVMQAVYDGADKSTWILL
jgi:predicted dehydrogenase